MVTCNIDQRGRKVRLVIGAMLEATGLGLGVLWYLGMVPPETVWLSAGTDHPTIHAAALVRSMAVPSTRPAKSSSRVRQSSARNSSIRASHSAGSATMGTPGGGSTTGAG
jgi:hypothetical protein